MVCTIYHIGGGKLFIVAAQDADFIVVLSVGFAKPEVCAVVEIVEVISAIVILYLCILMMLMAIE